MTDERPFSNLLTSKNNYRRFIPTAAKVTAEEFAAMIVYRNLAVSNASGFDYSNAIKIEGRGSQQFFDHLCGSLDLDSRLIRNFGLEWGVRVCSTSDGAPISVPYRQDVTEAVLDATSPTHLEGALQIWKETSRRSTTGFDFIVPLIGVAAAVGFLRPPSLSSLDNCRLQSTRLVAHQAKHCLIERWIEAAHETGEVSLSFREAAYGIEKSKDPDMRLFYREALQQRFLTQNIELKRIENLRDLSIQQCHDVIEAAATRGIRPIFPELRKIRGLVFEATSDAPYLRGTSLQILALPR